MARDILAITASSASSERVFSSGRDLIGISRHKLIPQTMEACICLRSWFRNDVVKNKDFSQSVHSIENENLSSDIDSESEID